MNCMNCSELVTYKNTWVKLCHPCYIVWRKKIDLDKSKVKLHYYQNLLPILKHELMFIDKEKSRESYLTKKFELAKVEAFIKQANPEPMILGKTEETKS